MQEGVWIYINSKRINDILILKQNYFYEEYRSGILNGNGKWTLSTDQTTITFGGGIVSTIKYIDQDSMILVSDIAFYEGNVIVYYDKMKEIYKKTGP